MLDKNVDKYLIKSSNIKIIGQEIINLIGASDTFRELFLELNEIKLWWTKKLKKDGLGF